MPLNGIFFGISSASMKHKDRARKAQVAIEYLIVVTIALLILSPLIMSSQRSVSDLNREIANLKAYNALYKIKEAADIVYSQGPPSKMTIYVSFPKNTRDVFASQNTLVVELGPEDMITHVLITMDYNIVVEGTPTTGGMQEVGIQAQQNYVNITFW